ncbi:uncharacterized protein LOC128386529 [Panonychus citri]|uniref:uncharacterized protein LOC128386529 n=1 Tax=Panonychus citri TaxID=50023 RepID=UPI002307D01C|nr:uncharacterized protein LOC128386529 [Panonychus citri]
MGLKNFGHVPDDLVQRIRVKFLEYVSNQVTIDGQDESLFYQEDIDKITNEDWYIKRFVIAAYKNETEALEKLIDTMKWRKNIKLRETVDNYFPNDFYDCGAVFPYENDIHGDLSLWIRCGAVRKFGEYTEAGKRFMVHRLFQIDELAGPKGYALVIDFTGAGTTALQNLDLLHHFITTLHHRFPAGVNYCLNYQIPWLLKTVWGAVQFWIPEKRRDIIQFSYRNDLYKYFELAHVPSYLSGECKRSWKEKPENCPTTLEFGLYELGLTEDDAARTIADYEHFRDSQIVPLDRGEYS